MNRALRKTKKSVSGKNQIYLIIIINNPHTDKGGLHELFDKVWEEGKLPVKWKAITILIH